MQKTYSRDQKGMVAIVVCLVIMVIITLVVIGFARVAERERRQALDRQLGTQAFYAAETAVNRARERIASDPNFGASGVEICDPVTPANDNSFSEVGSTGTNNVTISCVTINRRPPNLVLDQVAPDINNAYTFRLHGLNGTTPSPIRTLRFSWGSADPSVGQCASSPASTDVASWGCGQGALKVTVLAIPSGSFSRADLLAQRTSSFTLMPFGTPSGVQAFASGTDQNTGRVLYGTWNNTNRRYEVDISTIPDYLTPTATDGSGLYVQIGGLVNSSRVIVEAFDNGAPQNRLDITGAQAAVDATGRVGDVLRRVNVRVPLGQEAYRISTSGPLCKRVEIENNQATNSCPIP
jgi:Tfp pilus assembly protein PilX